MSNMYLSGLAAFKAGSIIWTSADIRMLLVTSSYTFDESHDFVSNITNECTNSGYARQALAGKALTEVLGSHFNKQTSSNVTFTSVAAGSQPYAAILYLYNAADASAQLICYCPLTTPPAPNGGNYVINCPANGWFTDGN